MKGHELLDVLGGINEEYVQTAHTRTHTKKRLLIAACFVMILVSTVLIWHFFFSNNALVITPDGNNADHPNLETSLLLESQEKQNISVERSYPQFSLEDLVQQSSLVICGKAVDPVKILEIQSASQNEISVFTDWIFQVESVIRGGIESETVTVRIEGGESPNYIVNAEQSPEFKKDCLYLLFLYQPHMGTGFNTEGDDYYYVIGLRQGAFLTDSEFEIHYNPWQKLSIPATELVTAVKELDPKYEIDEFYLLHHNQQRMDEMLQNQEISEEEYRVWLSQIDTYATIIYKEEID